MRFLTLFCHLLLVCLWKCCFTPLSLSILIYRLEIVATLRQVLYDMDEAMDIKHLA